MGWRYWAKWAASGLLVFALTGGVLLALAFALTWTVCGDDLSCDDEIIRLGKEVRHIGSEIMRDE